jgi:hypothetical protein
MKDRKSIDEVLGYFEGLPILDIVAELATTDAEYHGSQSNEHDDMTSLCIEATPEVEGILKRHGISDQSIYIARFKSLIPGRCYYDIYLMYQSFIKAKADIRKKKKIRTQTTGGRQGL